MSALDSKYNNDCNIIINGDLLVHKNCLTSSANKHFTKFIVFRDEYYVDVLKTFSNFDELFDMIMTTKFDELYNTMERYITRDPLSIVLAYLGSNGRRKKHLQNKRYYDVFKYM